MSSYPQYPIHSVVVQWSGRGCMYSGAGLISMRCHYRDYTVQPDPGVLSCVAQDRRHVRMHLTCVARPTRGGGCGRRRCGHTPNVTRVGRRTYPALSDPLAVVFQGPTALQVLQRGAPHRRGPPVVILLTVVIERTS